MSSKKEELEKVLYELERVGDMDGAAIVSRDGLIMAAALVADIDVETFGAMSAAMNGAAETAMGELKRGVPERVIVESKDAKIIAVGAGPTAILVALASPKASLGIIMNEVRKAADKISAILER